jgi:hypothetical protein
MFTLNKDQEQKLQQKKEGFMNEEIEAHKEDDKWKQQYDQEYKAQYKRIKGMSAMGKGEFSEGRVKEETLSQMKKDAIYQNAINYVELSASKKKEGDDDDEIVIQKQFCVPNCVKKHEHKYLYDYSKDYKVPV